MGHEARGKKSQAALIVGAGIGGLAAGVALRRAGWQVRIFERAASPRELGFALNLAPNAMAALRELGLAERLIAEGHVPVAGEARHVDGRVLRRVNIAAAMASREVPSLVALRPALHGALLNAVEPDAPIFESEAVGRPWPRRQQPKHARPPPGPLRYTPARCSREPVRVHPGSQRSEGEAVPISRERVLEIARRLGGEESAERLARRLEPTPAERRPVPPDVPAPREMTAEGRDLRRKFLRERGLDIAHLSGERPQPSPESLQGNIELFFGMTQIPTALIGPLRINGLHAHGDYYVPLATSEGALAASYHRGARLLTRAGGVSCLTTAEQVQRAPGFEFATLAEAGRFAAWVTGQFERLREVAATRTRHGELLDMDVHLEARTVYLILDYRTGDASGQNMVTLCTQAVCTDLLARTPVAPRHWFIESNMSGDKKATVLSFLNTRGRKVLADAVVPRALVEQVLHTSPERMRDYWQMCFFGGVQSGSIGVSGHVANGLAAMFLACGQDVACVSEASVGITRFELTPDGDLRCGVSLPNLIVGTVGGGTRLPTAAECLRILGCEGAGKASCFAEICAGVALAGELSIAGAMCSDDFARAHEKLGRRGAP